MAYFDDLKVIMGRHIPGCRVHVKSAFPDFYTVEYMHAGRMYWRVDGGLRHILERPALFWHMPGKIYEYGPADAAGWDHYYLILRGPRARRLVQDGFTGLSGDGFVFAAQPGAVREIFSRLLAILKERGPGMAAESVILLERLLQMAALASPAGAVDVYEQKIRAWTERMRLAPFAAYQAPALALEMHVCVGHFRRLFRRHCGRSFYDYLLHCRMLQAAAWLEEEVLPVKEAADRAGYADPAQFTKLFKKQIGLSPRQYRAAIQCGGRQVMPSADKKYG